MYSKKLKMLIQHVNDTDLGRVHRAALVGLQMRLKRDAENQACLRCEDADFFLQWRPLDSAQEGDAEWVPVLGRCGKFMGLASNPDAGLFMPVAPFPHCTAMTTAMPKLDLS
jgi:hypothetical protein